VKELYWIREHYKIHHYRKTSSIIEILTLVADSYFYHYWTITHYTHLAEIEDDNSTILREYFNIQYPGRTS